MPKRTIPAAGLRLGGAMLICIAVALAYFPAVRGDFILDDDAYLTNSNVVQASDGLYRIWCTTDAADYYPVSNTSLWLEWRLWGANSTPYHVTNLLMHIAVALLVWVVLRQLSIPGAYLAALLFAVHPINVESVAWIAQRKGLLAMVFVLLSALCFLRGENAGAPTYTRRSAPIWYGLSLLAFLLAMLSKGSVAVLPLILLLIVWWQRKRITRFDLLRTSPFWFVAVALTAVNIWCQARLTQTPFRAANFAERLAGAGAVVWFYLSQALAPVRLIFVYPQWRIQTSTLLWWLPLAAALVVTVLLTARCNSTPSSWPRAVLFAWIFFCVALLPVMGFTDVGYMQFSLVADHYAYLALIGVTAAVAAAWSVWHRRARNPARTIAIVAAAVAVGSLMLLTCRQCSLYASPVALYRATLRDNPNCWLAYNNLGLALAKTHPPQDVIEYYQQAVRLNPAYADAQNNLGTVLLDVGRTQEAIELCEFALRLRPGDPSIQYNLARALVRSGRTQEAIDLYRQAIESNPNDFDTRANLGGALIKAGRTHEGLEQFELAQQLKPDSPKACFDLAIMLKQSGQLQQAMEYYEQALKLQPNYPEAHNNLGIVLKQSGRYAEAIRHYHQALQLKPDFTEAMVNLATAYAQSDRRDEAIATAEKALQLAKSQNQTALAEQIESWLKEYRADPQKADR